MYDLYVTEGIKAPAEGDVEGEEEATSPSSSSTASSDSDFGGG